LTATAQICFSFDMSTRAKLLADHFIKCAGIAAVYVDVGGAISADDNVGAFAPGDVVLCCARAEVTPRSPQLPRRPWLGTMAILRLMRFI
jgi:hypothetical protein